MKFQSRWALSVWVAFAIVRPFRESDRRPGVSPLGGLQTGGDLRGAAVAQVDRLGPDEGAVGIGQGPEPPRPIAPGRQRVQFLVFDPASVAARQRHGPPLSVSPGTPPARAPRPARRPSVRRSPLPARA